MINRIVELLMKSQMDNRIDKDMIPVFRYGYTILFEAVINICVSIAIGIIMKELYAVLLFNLFFVPLRGFCGGWHAEKSWICSFISFFSVLVAIIIGKYELFQYGTIIWIIVVATSIIFILFKAPVDSKAKKLSASEVKHIKKIVLLIIFVECLMLLAFVYFDNYRCLGVIGTALVIQAIALLVKEDDGVSMK